MISAGSLLQGVGHFGSEAFSIQVAGEKLHEVMVTAEDAPNTLEFEKNFIIYPVIEKYLINGETETSREKRERIREEREQERNMSVLSEEEFNALSEIKSEYVYVNGKLIKRSEYEAQQNDEDS